MKATLIGTVACFIAGILVALLQLWFSPWAAAVFIKLEITLGAVLAVLLVVWFTRKEYREYRRQRDDTALDD